MESFVIVFEGFDWNFDYYYLHFNFDGINNLVFVKKPLG